MEHYLLFVLGCMGIEFVSIVSCINKLKKAGYKFNVKKKSFFVTFFEYVKLFLKNCIPLYNVILAASTLMAATNENCFDIFIEKCIEKGMITKTEEQLNKEEAEMLAKLEEEEIRKSLDTKDEDIVNKYSMMSDEEKLAFLKKERDNILNSQVEGAKVYQKK